MKTEPKSKADHADKHSLDAFREPRLYPRFWDMTDVPASSNNSTSNNKANFAGVEEQNPTSEEAQTDNVAFDDWQLSRHYPGEDTAHNHTFTAY